MTTILITGCAGFIGSFLARALIKKGNDVVGIDNFDAYYAKAAKEFNVDLIRLMADQKPNKFEENIVKQILDKIENDSAFKDHDKAVKKGKFDFIECDIRDKALLEKVFNETRPEKVIHLAAMAGVPYSIKAPAYYADVNVVGTVNLLELCARYKIKQFVFGSSSSVYGERTDVPFKETDDISKPISPYAATKVMGEIVCYTYSHLYGLPITIIRIFGGVYGPLQRPYGMAAQRFIRQVDHNKPITIFGDGSMARDCTNVEDIVLGLLLALDRSLGCETINIGSEKPVTVLELARCVRELFGKGEIKHIDKPRTEAPITYADISKAKKLLGYSPQVKLKEGLKRQFEVYMMMPQWYRDLPE